MGTKRTGAKKSKISVKTRPEYLVEDVYIKLDLNDEDTKLYKASPKKFLTKALRENGFLVNRMVIGGEGP